jgi:putative oxidoreductase
MTEESNIIQKLARAGLKICDVFSFLPPLLTRLVIGYAFYGTGKGKLGDLGKVTGFFTGLGIPFPHANAVFIACLECFGGVLLMVGLLTRPIAALLGCTMIVALMTADREDLVGAFSGGDKGLTDVTPVVFGMFLLWLMIYGPGLISIDAVIRRALHIDAARSSDSAPNKVTQAETI